MQLQLKVCDHAVPFTYFTPDYAVNEVQENQERLEYNGLYRVYVDDYGLLVRLKGYISQRVKRNYFIWQ